MRLSTGVLAIGIVVGLAGVARAQGTGGPFTELARKVTHGDEVVVVESGGRFVKGRISDITASAITLVVPSDTGSSASAPRTFQAADVLRIVRHDGKWNGMLIGAAAGAVPASFLFQFACGEGPNGTCAQRGFLGALAGGGLGAALGAGIDLAINKTVYVAGGKKTTLHISPIVGADRRGARVAIRF